MKNLKDRVGLMNYYKGNIERLDNWEKLKLKDACSRIFSGGTPNTNKIEYWNGSLPWLSSGETRNRLISKTENKITELGVTNSSTRLAKAGSSVIASAGQGHTRGQVSYLLIDTYINQSVIALFPRDEKLDSKFLFYSLNMKYERLRQISDDHSIRGSLTTKLLGEELIDVPPIQEQKAIAKILSDLDSKIELNQKMNKTLEAIAQAIFKHWFIDFEFPNEEGKPYKSSGGEMVDSELGEIPKGWEVKRIKDLCVSIENGGTPRRMEKKYWNGEINWFKTGELLDRPLIDSSEKITKEGLINSSCKLWKINTILIALYASPTVGRLGLLKVDGASNQACSGLVAKEKIGYPYLFYTLSFKRNEFNNIASGAAQQNINQEIIKESKCIEPPLKLMNNFNRVVSKLIDKQTLLAKEEKTLSNVRDSILLKLIMGKIRVPLEE